MTATALLLILSSAFLHASWNLLAKRISAGSGSGRSSAVVWLFTSTTAVVYLPFVVWLAGEQFLQLTPVQWAFVLLATALHLAYSLTLQRGYAVGDLTVVYPIARGSGPLLALIAAVLLLGERPSMLALTGAALIVVGVFLLAGGRSLLRSHTRRPGAGYGVLTGAWIASYTVVDGYTVTALAVMPLLLDYITNVLRAVLLLPSALRQRAAVAAIWQLHRWPVIGIGVLGPLSYILFLEALKTTPISYAAPTREISLLIGAMLGAKLLNEGNLAERVSSAGLIAAGVALIVAG